jgi:hypothetical protein
MKLNLRFFSPSLLVFSFLFFTGIGFSQMADIPYHIEPYSLESGYYNGTGESGASAELAFSGSITVPDAPWLSISFSKAYLGEGSYLIIRSLYDDHWQKLDEVSIKQWNYFSAFFNGGELEVNLYVAPEDKHISFSIEELIVGDHADDGLESICGTTDDRELSNQQATGRLLNVGCTGWIIPNGKIVSAGHCLSNAGSVNVLQFNVPPSLPNGTIQHPGPEDQYSADVASRVFVNGGVGNDWGVFEVFPNSVTNLMPIQAQGTYWPLIQDLGPDSIRITGYGVASGVRNQVQQTHVGPNWGSSGTTMRYRTDTTGGNSGSPVIDEATGRAVGVHTHGGCTSTGGNNSGTSFFSTAFWAAVDQGAGGCPVEPASDPIPAHASVDVSINLAQLSWTNGIGAVTNELYFGTNPGSLNLVQSGTLATSWAITGGPLDYFTTYYWRVDEIGDTCSTQGAVWSFTTEMDPLLQIDEFFCDDFESGLNDWTITNDGGTCVWEIFTPPYPNAYTLPATSSGGVLAADSDECGSGTTFLSTATINSSFDFTAQNYQYAEIVFDNDFRIIGASDEAHVEISTDGGTTWNAVWSKVGVDARNTTEVVDITSDVTGQSDVRFRFRVVQPGWDWWWVVDNVCIYGHWVVPVELTSFAANAAGRNVDLSWTTATETNNQGFHIERSNGGEFEAVGFVAGHGTTTETRTYVYTDKNIPAGSYSYRLKQVDYDGTFEYSDVVEVEVGAPAEFALDQNYPNPFNPSTKINFRLAADSKVSLKVFDVLGQEVMTLINNEMTAGSHQVEFDAVNLNSGVYFYKLEATGNNGINFSDVKKMILTK